MKIQSKGIKKQLKKIDLGDHNPDNAAQPNSPVGKEKPDIGYMLDQIIKRGTLQHIETHKNYPFGKNEFFCSQPFIHMYIPTYGLAGPCCNTGMTVKKHISEIGLDGVWNQPELASLREEMANGNLDRERTIKTCYRCIETEYHGYATPRTLYINDTLKDPIAMDELKRLRNYVVDNPNTEYPIPDIIHTAQIKVFGNYCNLKCLMCSPEDSSSVAEELILLNEMTPQDILDRTIYRSGYDVPFKPPLIKYSDNNIDEDEFWNTIRKTIRIQLIGGETWLIKQNFDILERCVKEGWAKDKRLFIFSNNSIIPNREKVFEYLSQFKSVHYKCSMELWGNKNDYIRFPAKWNRVFDNIKYMSRLKNLNLGFAFTVNPLNAGYVHEAVIGADKHFNARPSFFNVTRPVWFTLKSLPEDIKDIHLSRLYSQPDWVIERCKMVIDFLEKAEFNEEQYHNMIEKIISRDKLRGDNILKYFPEWKEHVKHDDYYGIN